MYLVEDGYDIRALQELLGHRAVGATMMHTSVLNRGGTGGGQRNGARLTTAVCMAITLLEGHGSPAEYAPCSA
jgi:hypothetical protein